MDVREKTASAETPETLVELIPVPGETVGEGREQNPGGYNGFVVVLDRVRAGRDGEVLGHVIGELWWFEGGVGVELWSDLAGEPPVGPGTNRQR